MIEMPRNLLESLVDLLDLSLVFFYIEEAYSTNRYFEQPVDIFRCHGPRNLIRERFESLYDRFFDSLLRSFLFDLLVDALLDENSLKCASMQPIKQMPLF